MVALRYSCAAAGASRRVREQPREPSPERSRPRMLWDLQPKALPLATWTRPWRPCARVYPMPTCTRRPSQEVRFAGKSAGETLGLIPHKTSLQQLTALLIASGSPYDKRPNGNTSEI